MPELPEVETVRKILLKYLQGHTIIDCSLFFNKIIKYPDPLNFVKQVKGQKIHDISRRGKHLLFMLDDYVLISHLRMEGKYFIAHRNDPGDWKHILITFDLDNDQQLRYHDTRRFGTMHLYSKEDYLTQGPLLKVGYEPFDTKITLDYLKSYWSKKNQPIKTTLLEQNVVAGIGNIYANEILFACKIHPGEKTKNLTDEDYQNIIYYAKEVLQNSIRQGGTTIATYHPEPGVDGKFTQRLQVHGRVNKPCYKCGTQISKDFINGRGTYYCEQCQRLKLIEVL